MILRLLRLKTDVSNEHLKGKHTNIYAKDYIALRTLLIMLSCSMLKHRLLFGVTLTFTIFPKIRESVCVLACLSPVLLRFLQIQHFSGGKTVFPQHGYFHASYMQ